MDGRESFAYLCDNIPQWNERLETLTRHIQERNAEFQKLTAETYGDDRDAALQAKRMKTGSMESLRPVDETKPELDDPSMIALPPRSPPQEVQDAKMTDVISGLPLSTTGKAKESNPSTPGPATRVEVNTESRRLFQDFRLNARRKRNSASMASNASGPRKWRSRMSLVVYYDSTVQNHFEWLVRGVSSARNNLRKGKTTASFKARLAGMNMEQSPFAGGRGDMPTRNRGGHRKTGSRGGRPASNGSGDTGGSDGSYFAPEAFESADKELEAAQTLCEIGAHQFLREGSCDDELAGTRERFVAVLELAKEQRSKYEAAEELRKREEKRKSAEKKVAEDKKMVDADEVKVDSMTNGDLSLAIDPNHGGDDDIEIDPRMMRRTRRSLQKKEAQSSGTGSSHKKEDSGFELTVDSKHEKELGGYSLEIDPNDGNDNGGFDLTVDDNDEGGGGYSLAIDPDDANDMGGFDLTVDDDDNASKTGAYGIAAASNHKHANGGYDLTVDDASSSSSSTSSTPSKHRNGGYDLAVDPDDDKEQRNGYDLSLDPDASSGSMVVDPAVLKSPRRRARPAAATAGDPEKMVAAPAVDALAIDSSNEVSVAPEYEIDMDALRAMRRRP